MALRYTFGRSEFDAGLGLLTVAGEASVLRPRTAAVLEELLKRAGGVVTRDELMRAAWPGRVVTTNSVEQCVSELRRGLNGAGPLLRTLPRRGYVIEADVRVSEPTTPAANGSRTLALLPLGFEGAAGRRFAEALSADLADGAARAPCVHVVSPAATASLARGDGDFRRLAADLGADYVILGRVSRQAGRWQLSLAAVETRRSRQVWADRIEARAASPAVEQRRLIAERACALLSSELTAIESGAPPTGRTRDAREMTKRAYHLWLRELPGISREAYALAREAATVEPAAAGPWAMMAYWHLSAATTRAAADRPGAIDAAIAASRKALALDPQHRLAHGALGGALTCAGQHDAALAALERQIAINPTPGAYHLLARLQLLRGRSGLALAAASHALAIAPTDSRRSAFLDTLALAHLHRGNDRRALAFARQGVAEPRPWPRAYETLALAAGVNRRSAEANQAVATLLSLWPGYTLAHHRNELAMPSRAFLRRHARLARALERAGLPRS